MPPEGVRDPCCSDEPDLLTPRNTRKTSAFTSQAHLSYNAIRAHHRPRGRHSRVRSELGRLGDLAPAHTYRPPRHLAFRPQPAGGGPVLPLPRRRMVAQLPVLADTHRREMATGTRRLRGRREPPIV